MLTPRWDPDRRTLRQFAALWLAFFICLGLYRAWRVDAFEATLAFQGPWVIPILLWSLAGAVGIPGIIEPRLARPIYIGALAVGFPIGWVVSHVLLAVVYFGLFTAFSLVFRLMGRDRLDLRWDRNATTYWKDRRSRSDLAQYFRLS